MRRLVGLLAATVAAGTILANPAGAVSAVAATAQAAPSTLADSPPMGWNSWNKFNCNINEQVIRNAADAMVSTGMKAAGYTYVNIDDCWAEHDRDAQGKLVANHERFPSGIKALADYVHGKGLKLGIYTSAGTMTCANTMPGALDHEQADAQIFADWGVDYVKYDNCNNQDRPAIDRYKAMGDALKATGRPIVYALCEWGQNKSWLWGKDVGGQLWRTTGDISDNWSSMLSNLDQQVGLEKYAGPGAWNDPDMLEVGNGGMTDTEYRAHFALWSLLNAPLIAGNDLASMSDATKQILTNKNLIAVDQDWGGVQGHKVRDDGDLEVWTKPMSDGSSTVVLFNRGETTAAISSTAKEIGLGSARDYQVRELWSNAVTESTGTLRASVPAHGAAVYRVSPSKFPAASPATTLSLSALQYTTADKPFTATTQLFNDGSTPVVAGQVHLDVPSGWVVSGQSDARTPLVLPGKSWMQTWTVRPQSPTGTSVAVKASAHYLTVTGPKTATDNASLAIAAEMPSGTNALSKASWISAANGWGPVERDMSNGEQAQGDGHPITIHGAVFTDGFGVHAPSDVRFYLGGGCKSLDTLAGLDDEENQGSVSFQILGDGKLLAATDVFRPGMPAAHLQADLAGVQVIDLVVTDGGDGNSYDHADWARPTLTC
ncbi:MAG: Conserved putative secreted protein [Amycolatopsis sp.]|uniref:NPCBM/NEW2 domain-containing protein n=1 Tax=Amycolatopsis sp. TaxID=37632 RepID=UPI00261C1C60|nr:NPCBM/NEW2 domain-containing protein [Amycolatopsis sp.]MCU1683206.1 Conserved putative secreted protein [Amycolatopsis sp.]